MASDGRCGRHGRAHQVGASATALTSFEIPIAGGSGSLAGLEDIGIHPEAHRTARLAPLEAGVHEHAVEPFAFGGGLHALRAGHDERLNAFGNTVPASHHGGSAE